MNELDLQKEGVRGINSHLHSLPKNTNEKHWVIHNPKGQHAIACGLDAPFRSRSGAMSASIAAA